MNALKVLMLSGHLGQDGKDNWDRQKCIFLLNIYIITEKQFHSFLAFRNMGYMLSLTVLKVVSMWLHVCLCEKIKKKINEIFNEWMHNLSLLWKLLWRSSAGKPTLSLATENLSSCSLKGPDLGVEVEMRPEVRLSLGFPGYNMEARKSFSKKFYLLFSWANDMIKYLSS